MPSLLALIFLQALWTSSYVAMKVAMVSMPIGLVMILRYGIAAFTFLLLGQFRGFRNFSKKDWLLIVGVGICAYSLSPFFQLKSLTLTQVVDVGVLTAIEPLVTALLAALLIREKLSWDLILLFFMATFGVILLSDVTWERFVSPLTETRLIGNFLFLWAVVFEGLNSVAGRTLTQRHPPLSLVAWMMAAGFLANLAANLETLSTMPPLQTAWRSWVAVGYLAFFCSVIGYGGWFLLVKKNPVSRLALSLFLQPVFGILFGYFLMGEKVSLRSAMGIALILAPLLLWVLHDFQKQQKNPVCD